MDVSESRRLFVTASSEVYDDKISKCVVCGKMGITKLEQKSLCAKHYVMLEDEKCLETYLIKEFTLDQRPLTLAEMQSELRKQKPAIYKRLQNHFVS